MSTLALVFLSLTLKSRNREIAAARALLRDIVSDHDDLLVEAMCITQKAMPSAPLVERIRSYLDACDTLGGDTVPDEVAP